MAGSGGVAGSGGSAGSAGSGGSGPCQGLALVEPILEIVRPATHADDVPLLTASSDDGEQLTVAFQRYEPAVPGGARQALHASLRPWESWPESDIETTFSTFTSVGLDPTFAVGHGFSDRFSMLVSHSSLVDSFAPRVNPNASSAGPNLTLSTKGAPVFVARGSAGWHLVADSDGHVLMGHVIRLLDSNIEVTDVLLACGGDAGVADAVAHGEGWLLALGNEKTAPPTGCSAAANGPTRLDILFVDQAGGITPLHSLDAGAPITDISVAPHPEGAHVTWRVMSGGLIAPIRWLRIDAAANAIVGPGDVSGPGDAPLGGFDAAAMGEHLAVVWRNDPADNPPDLTLTLLDPQGTLVAQTALEPPFTGRPSIAGAPAGDSVVVAHQESGTTVKLLRFDCLP